MMNRKTLLASGIAAAIFSVSTVGAVNLQTSNPGAISQPSFNNPNGATTLYSQIDNPSGNGAPAQNFSSSNDAYDAEGADDFVVPAGGWTIGLVNLVTTVGTPTSTVAAVTFYSDAAGLPGAAVCSYPTAPAVISTTNTVITLPTDCTLSAGTYWVGVSIDLNFGSFGQVFWSNRTTQSNGAGAWRNPGDGFGSGCTAFTAMTTCGVGGGTNPDFLFQLVGEVGGGGVPLAPPRELPTLSQWSALLAASGLALLGLFGVRRRSRR